MKKINDFTPYTNILPYASEIFGVYQPMIGWKSKRMKGRMEKGFSADLSKSFESLHSRFKGRFEIALDERLSVERIERLEPARLDTDQTRTPDSFVIESIARELPPLEEYDDAVWDRALQPNRLQQTLTQEVIPQTMKWHASALRQPNRGGGETQTQVHVAQQLNRESAVAGYLLYLKEKGQFTKLKDFFYKADTRLLRLQKLFEFRDPLEYIDPFKDIDRAGLSPIGIVHLFRQYFFEFDTFLGSPVGHVWLSPGASVELVEISTRKTVVERSFESTMETNIKTEKSTTDEDEISDAVKQDNKSDTKFGVNATANQSWIGGSATASSSIDIASTQQKAREVSHKRMRSQTEKLSTEIRRNYKTTFKTVTETTDTSSKRYILANTTDKLINYEMRRKMRQVGVQVQDIGTYLCWQTYVDDPGRQLGIAKLVHLAKGPEVGTVPPPETVPMPGDLVTEHPIDIPFVPRTEDTIPEDDMDEAYRDGVEVNLDYMEGESEKIQSNFDGFYALCDQPNYQYADDIQFDYGGNDIEISIRDIKEETAGKVSFGIHLKHVNFRNVSPLRVVAKVRWRPTQEIVDAVNEQNKKNVDQFNEQSRHEYEKAFVEAARERIKLASKIESRKFEDLREEERIVVYRALIQEMLTKDLPMPDDRTRHVVSELLNAIFDIDKMLYFVAPEWWRPRLHQSHQALGDVRKPSPLPGGSTGGASAGGSWSIYGELKADASKFKLSKVSAAKEDKQVATMDTVTWGGTGEHRADNYYITDESDPAKLGASLGWLLQLDGDNLRNAFLNAPWVKAVIPIRPGQERAAINWLQRLHVEGTEGLDDQYVAPPAQLAEIPHTGPAVTIRDAIEHLCDTVAKKHEESMAVGRYPGDEINDDNRVSATPVEKVYEHGFYPLQGGFRLMPEGDFEIFDQWVEILPTDQVVPVEVTYDPKTGRQL